MDDLCAVHFLSKFLLLRGSRWLGVEGVARHSIYASNGALTSRNGLSGKGHSADRWPGLACLWVKGVGTGASGFYYG